LKHPTTVELLHRRPWAAGPTLRVLGLSALLVAGCGPEVPPELQPDDVLRRELGLTESDEVHRISLTGSDREQVVPPEVTVPPAAWVEFVSADWRVHEVHFEADSLSVQALGFLTRTSQMDSPPLLHKDARFVVSFQGAPEGRYPFRVDGNRAPGRGVVVVLTRH
jgi:hypothetical protein